MEIKLLVKKAEAIIKNEIEIFADEFIYDKNKGLLIANEI